jgi:hypothetical protein
MFIGVLRFCLIAGLWCLALWLFLLPVDLTALSIPALVGAHIGPPLLVEAGWFAFKRVRVARAKKKVVLAEKTGESSKQAEIDSARAAREAELRHRRAHAECRRLWLDIDGESDLLKGAPEGLFMPFVRQGAQGAESKTLLPAALQQVLESVLSDEYLAWLPVYLVPGHKEDAQRLKWIAQAWQEAAAIYGIETRCQCGMLPGKGSVTERVIDLFENDPEVPALILVGMDSPLADGMEDTNDADTKSAPGHVVAMMLLSRPGLGLPGDARAAPVEQKEAGVYTPYWERGDMSAHLVPGWGEMPEKYLPDFLEIKPLAALCRSRPVICPGRKELPALKEALENALVDAGARKLPFESEQDGKPEEPPEPPELGWLVYNNGEGDQKAVSSRHARLMTCVSTLGCELDMTEERTILDEECGDVGAAARSVLILIAAIARAGQLQKPVLAAEFREEDEIVLGLVRPVLSGIEQGQG